MKTRTAKLKADFDAAHKDGLEALRTGDYDRLGDAVVRERRVIEAIKRQLKRVTRAQAVRRRNGIG